MTTLEVPVNLIIQIEIEGNGEWGWNRVVRVAGLDDIEPADLEGYLEGQAALSVHSWKKEVLREQGSV